MASEENDISRVRASTPLHSFHSQAQSWGVELEFVLAFHRERLQRVLDQYEEKRRPQIVPVSEVRHDSVLQNARLMVENEAHGREKWPAWVLRVKPSDRASMVQLERGHEVDWHKYRIPGLEDLTKDERDRPFHRTYALEPLLIAQDILFKVGLQPQIIGGRINKAMPGEDEPFLELFERLPADQRNALFPHMTPAVVAQLKLGLNYDKWILTKDFSVFPATQGQIRAALGLPEHEKKNWNSDGVELISRKYSYEEITRGCKKLERYLQQLGNHGPTTGNDAVADSDCENEVSNIPRDALGSERTWAALESVFAGTHVHVGLNWSKPEHFNFDLLRHLAFLIVTNEHLLSNLHPYRRRADATTFTPIQPVFSPGRKPSEKEEIRVAELEEKFVTGTSLHSNRKVFEKYVNSKYPKTLQDRDLWTRARTVFFNPNLSEQQFFYAVQLNRVGGLSHGSVVDLGRIYEFWRHSRLSPGEQQDRTLRPCTVEFRQHGCTLSAEDVEYWVRFLFALVRLAEKRAQQDTDWQDQDLYGNEYDTEQDEQIAKYPPPSSNGAGGPAYSLDELLGPANLDLPAADMTYWQWRFAVRSEDARVHLEATSSRRSMRRQRKLRFGKRLNSAEMRRTPVETHKKKFYERKKKDELAKHILERLYIPETALDHAAKKKRLVNKHKKKDLVNMAIRMEKRLQNGRSFFKKEYDEFP